MSTDITRPLAVTSKFDWDCGSKIALDPKNKFCDNLEVRENSSIVDVSNDGCSLDNGSRLGFQPCYSISKKAMAQ